MKLPAEFKIVALRECPLPDAMQLCDTPDKAVEYWRTHIATSPLFNPECECFGVLLLNTRRKVRGHNLVTIGTMDTLLVHAREVFRVAIMGGSHAIVLMHNLCAAPHRLCYVKCGVTCAAKTTRLERVNSKSSHYAELGIRVIVPCNE